ALLALVHPGYEVMILELAKSVLETAGYLVVPARHGIEALALVKEAKQKGEPIDLMILDLTVPSGMGGKETVFKLREFDKMTPVICSSGYSRDEVMSDPAKFGFADKLPKPYRVKDMLEVVVNNL
ncbi:MAG: response regulator, partial [Candidatus Firestonebacteria bacterium]